MSPELRNNSSLPNRSRGFVVAMRATLAGATRPPTSEWIVVSRWGTEGEYLSIGWTSLPAPAKEAPIDLTPRQTVLAVRRPRTMAWVPATFVLVDALPDRITVAGEFLPAEGYVRLFGKAANPRLRSRGKCPDPALHQPWNLEAARTAWIGEFIEAMPRNAGNGNDPVG